MAGGDPARDSPYGAAYYRDIFGHTRMRPFGAAWWSVRLHVGVARWCLRRNGGRRVLEIGCGQGFVLARLQDHHEVVGVDVSEHAIGECRRNAPRATSIVADVERDGLAELGDASFDLVLARYVFEHLRDPLAALERVAQLLRPGGALFFAVPNTESLGARWKGADWYALRDPTHCSLLAPDRWLALVREAGLEVQREFGDGTWDLPYLSWLPTALQAPLFLGPSALACLAARPLLPRRLGENVLVVARRP
jgi:SAM-dependent methyltransferase